MTTGPDIITALNADADLDRCAITPGPATTGPRTASAPAVEGGAPWTGQRFRVCSARDHLVNDPRPIGS